MRIYNPKQWFQILFEFHKSDTLRKLLPLIFCIAFYSAGVAYFELNFLNFSANSYTKNISQMHSLLSFALSLLLVFRTNTAYDRWWEGRKQWGALVNNSRNLAIKLNSLLGKNDTENRLFFKNAISLYASVLKDHLQAEATRFALDETAHPEFANLNTEKHAPNQIATMMTDRIYQLHKDGIISGEQLLFINPEITSFTDICGACERIKNTPIPYSYSAFIKKFIFIYVMTLPFGYVFTLGYFIVPISAIVFYVLSSLELIAEEIEEPFGKDSNDLPMDKMATNIRKHVSEIL